MWIHDLLAGAAPPPAGVRVYPAPGRGYLAAKAGCRRPRAWRRVAYVVRVQRTLLVRLAGACPRRLAYRTLRDEKGVTKCRLKEFPLSLPAS